MPSARRATWAVRIMFLILLILAVPTTLRITSPLYCGEPSDNPDISHHLLRNKAGARTDKLIIFIHGVNSSAHSAWLNKHTNAYWPEMFREDEHLNTAEREYDTYLVDYPSPYLCYAPNLETTASGILVDLRNRGLLDYKQIFIVAHSMGGLIAENILTSLQNDPKTLSHFKAVFFFGPPTEGSHLATLAAQYSNNLQYSDMRQHGSSYLRDLADKWSRLLQQSDSKAPRPKSICGYENYATSGQQVVNEDYESQYHCDQTIPIDTNHLDLVKPATVESRSYANTEAQIISLTEASVPEQISTTSGHAVLQDCWLDALRCGFKFSSAQVVPLADDNFVADVVLMNQTDQNKGEVATPAMLFAPHDSPPYSGGRDKGANSGILEVLGDELSQLKSAPPDGYSFHWFPVKAGALYVIRTRDGLHYAKLKVTELTNKSIAFDWVYQPLESTEFANASQ